MRLGLDVLFPICFDTMPLAAATLPGEQLTGLRLETVAQAMGVSLPHAHPRQKPSPDELASNDTIQVGRTKVRTT